MTNVITITGPSAAGKSTLARFLLGYRDGVFKPRLVPKYTTRPRRLDDSGEVVCVEAIPPECDLVYEHYEHLYGLKLETIENILSDRSTPIVILNDVRAVRKVRDALGEVVKSVFVFREAPSLEKYRDLATSVGVMDDKEPVRRFLQAQAFYHIYSENIQLFDYIIVNSTTFADLDVQVRQVVELLRPDPLQSLRPRYLGKLNRRLFVLVSAAGLAKSGLIQAIGKLGTRQAEVIPEDTIFGESEDRWYCQASKVLESLQEGVFPVLVIDSLDMVGKLYEIFKQFIVLVYVHSEADAEAYRRAGITQRVNIEYVQRRLEQYYSSFDAYLHRFLMFDHVLIDSGSPVHLLDQLFWLFRAYERGDLPRPAPKPKIGMESSDDAEASLPKKVCGGNARRNPLNTSKLMAGAPPSAC